MRGRGQISAEYSTVVVLVAAVLGVVFTAGVRWNADDAVKRSVCQIFDTRSDCDAAAGEGGAPNHLSGPSGGWNGPDGETSLGDGGDPDDSNAPSSSTSILSQQVASAADLLHELEIADESHHDSYDRDLFRAWITQDDGCSTRERVLIDESTIPAEVGDGCAVVSGEWVSWFDDETVTDPSELDIDHLVPLAEAWASGAHAWTADQLVAFGNDLDREDALVAVTRSSNRAKSDQDPADWLPPSTEAWCRYASAWVTQKHAWDLSVDAAERAQLATVLDDCP